MPNTLAHLGAQTIATRTLVRGADVKWIFVGVLVPDVPWILGRVIRGLAPARLDYDAWAYLVAQSSLAVSLLLCGAIALLSTGPRRVFVILGLNATMHLVLDALQYKHGNGVHLFAPMSWSTWNEGWFAIESWPTYALSALGLVTCVWALRQRSPWGLTRPGLGRVCLSAALLFVYFTLPATMRDDVLRADVNSIGTLAEREHRAGRDVGFDRVAYVIGPERHYVRVYTGEPLALDSRPLAEPGTVSGHATFINESTLSVQELHVHAGWPRNTMSYIGLAFVVAVWLHPLLERLRPRVAISGPGTGRQLR